MIAIFISLIIFVSYMSILFFWCKKYGYAYKKYAPANAAAAFCIAAVAFLVIEVIIILSAPFTTKEDKTEVVSSQEIIALQDISSISGHFFLGSGAVGDTEYYAYYFETEHGYKKGKINAETYTTPVYIKYVSEGETPHIDQYAIITRETLTNKPSIWLSILAYFKYKDCEAGDVLGATRRYPTPINTSNNPTEYYNNFRIEIHVPEGSIKENYNIDLE